MRVLEVRRHTMRTIPGAHLSQAGVSLAREVGGSIGPFDRVVTSKKPRAYETAIAMGFAVDERIETLASMPDAVGAEIDWSAGFGPLAAAIARGGAAAAWARKLARTLTAIALAAPEGGATLAISHGGIIEAATIGCLPGADHTAWGRGLDYCEGVRLTFEDERCTGAVVLRLERPTPIDGRVVRPSP